MQENDLNNLISFIESSQGFSSDVYLKRIADLLRSCTCAEDVSQKRKLIEKLVVDGVSDFQSGEKILNFLKL